MANANLEPKEISLGLHNLWSPFMASVLKSTVLSFGLLAGLAAAANAGLAAAANAQSVSALPTEGNTPPSYDRTLPVQNAHTGIAGSTQSFYPKPGGGAIWTESHYQPAAQSATERDRPQTPLAQGRSTGIPKPTSAILRRIDDAEYRLDAPRSQVRDRDRRI